MILWLFFVSLISSSIFADPENLDFKDGVYLGHGTFHTTAGAQGAYASYVNIHGNIWETANVQSDWLKLYQAEFIFDENEFFTVNLTEYDPSGEAMLHTGEGYCIKSACHMSAELDDGVLEETVIFNRSGSIDRLGSLTYIDENDDVQTIAWNERLLPLMNSNAPGERPE